MNANLLKILKQIIASHGENILSDPQRLKAVFSDFAKNEPKEDRVAFGRSIEQGFYQKLKQTSPTDRANVKASMISQLQTLTGYDTARCTSAINLLETLLSSVAPLQSQIKSISRPKISIRTLLFAVAAGIGALAGDLLGFATNVIGRYSSSDNIQQISLYHGLWTGLNGLGISIGIFLVLTFYLKRKLSIFYIIKSALIGITVGILGGFISPFISFRLGFWGVFGCGLGFGVSFYIKNFSKIRAMIAGLVGGVIGGIASNFMHFTPAVTILGFVIGLFISIAEETMRQAWITVIWGPKETRTIALGQKPIVFGSSSQADIYLSKEPPVRVTIQIENSKVVMYDKTTNQRRELQNGDRVDLGKVSIVANTKR
ncbi:MAG: hypothetical protein LBC76_02275 [Treponema sp.]|jgi:putative ubiquitin-RnfH superfamily antitoxin RatB of RatAB toxin-antitoxin module|nr:hypothetical protein [Treponema sp.]